MKQCLYKLIRHFTVNIKSKLFLRFVVTYIIVLLIPIFLIGIIVYNNLISLLASEVEKSTINALAQTHDNINERIKELNYLAEQLPKNKKIIPILIPQEENNLLQYEYYLCIDELNNYKAINAFIDSISIYIPLTDTVIGTKGKQSLSHFLSSEYNAHGFNESDFKNILKSLPEQIVKTVEVTNKDNESQSNTMYLRHIPVLGTNDENLLMVTMDSNPINKLLINVLGNNNGKVFILDGKGSAITSVSKGNFSIKTEILPSLIRAADSSVYTEEIDGQKIIISYIKSKDMGWSYLAIIPSDQILAGINNIRLWSLSIMALSIIIGIILAYLFSYGNYYPIKKIATALSHENLNEQILKSNFKNELDLINDLLSLTISKDKMLQKRIDKHMPIIRADFLTRLLKGKFIDTDETRKMAEFFDIRSFIGPFAVMIFNIDDYDEFTENNSGATQELYRFSIINVIEETTRSLAKCYTVEDGGNKIAVIIDFDGHNYVYQDEMISVGKSVKDFFEEHFKFTLTVGIGTVHISLMDVTKSYMEALAAAEYKMVKGKNVIIVFNQIITGSNERYYYSIQLESKVINCLKVGDFEGVQQVLSNIFGNILKKGISTNMARCVYFETINTAMKALADMRPEEYNLIMYSIDVLPDFLSCETLDEVYRKTESFYRIVCERVKSNTESKAGEFKNKILDFVEYHYYDNNLTLSLVANKFKTTPSYLSRLFKSYSNYNFIEYLHNLRVNKAKQLLVEMSEKNLLDIALSCGFSDDHSFIRTFKKYVGMTPGRYREINRI